MTTSFRAHQLYRSAICALALCGFAPFAHAGELHEELTPPWPRAIVSLLDETEGERVVQTFSADGGLIGWVIEIAKRLVIVYTTPDHQTLIAGSLYDENGRSLTEAHMEKYFPIEHLQELRERHKDVEDHVGDVSASELETLWGSLDQLFTVNAYSNDPSEEAPVPSGISPMYVFVDMNCIYCHMLAETLKPYQKQGLKVRWVPVALLGPDSVSRASLVINAANPLAAISTQMDLRSYPHDPLPSKTLDEPTVQILEKNTLAMRAFGGDGTPTIVWKDGSGAVHVHPGLLFPERIAQISGIPRQPITDMKLAELLEKIKSSR